MDSLTFTVELIKALAWPVTALLLFLALRRPLLDLLPLLVRVKVKDFEFDFGRRLEEVAAEAAALPTSDGAAPASLSDPQIRRQIQASPRGAILDAWVRLEAAAIEAARRQGVEVNRSLLRSPHELVQFLEEHNIIDARQAGVFHDLRGLRNSAAHATNFNPSPDAALEYVRLAATLEESLKSS